jgi:hypothetical protein
MISKIQDAPFYYLLPLDEQPPEEQRGEFEGLMVGFINHGQNLIKLVTLDVVTDQVQPLREDISDPDDFEDASVIALQSILTAAEFRGHDVTHLLETALSHLEYHRLEAQANANERRSEP